MSNREATGTFWDHLDELRNVLIKIALVAIVFGIIAFVFKDLLFKIVLAPKSENFITYKWLNKIGAIFSKTGLKAFLWA